MPSGSYTTPSESETGDRLGAEIKQLLDGVLRDVAAAGNQADLAFERVLAGLQHLVGEIHAAVAGGFGTNQRAAPGQALAGEHAGEFVAQPLVLAEEEADLASAHADVAGGNVGVGTDVAAEFGHEALAEAHDFVVTLALGIEIGPALAAAHGERGERVLEDLLEGEELQDAQVDRGMEAQAALVGADGAVHLDAETAIDLDVAMVVKPRNAEHQDALGFHDALENPLRDVLGVSLQHKAQRLHDFLHGLVEFRLGRVLGFHQSHYFVDVIARSLDSRRRHYSYCHDRSSSNLTSFDLEHTAGPRVSVRHFAKR